MLFTPDVESMTAHNAVWQNAIFDNDLRARDAITAKRIGFCRTSDPAFAPFDGAIQGWQRRPDVAGKRILASIGSTAAGDTTVGPLWAEAGSSGEVMKAQSNWFDCLAAGHSRSRSSWRSLTLTPDICAG